MDNLKCGKEIVEQLKVGSFCRVHADPQHDAGAEPGGEQEAAAGTGGGDAPQRGSFWSGAGDGVTPPAATGASYANSLTTANGLANSGSGGGGGGFGRATYSPNNTKHRGGNGGSGIVVIVYPT